MINILYVVRKFKKEVKMNDLFVHLDLGDFPKIDKENRRDDIINATKVANSLIKNSRLTSKPTKCYYCGKQCDSFCNSHTLPAFCLRNIAEKGKLFYLNSILDLPLLKNDKGVNESGTFHLICRECDSKIFQAYETPDNYDKIPNAKMLAQIDMKNNLKNISKRLTELEMYRLMSENYKINKEFTDSRIVVSRLDLIEYKDSFSRAKKRDIKPFSDDYYIGFYEKLPYVVPIAFQGTIALIFDLEGNVINDIYNLDPKYKIKNVSICVFPLEESSIIMLFVDRKNEKYRRFFKQLKKLDLENKLSIINYIIFSYSEDYFLSPNLDKKVLNKLKALSGKTPEMLGFYPTTAVQKLQSIQKIYDYNEQLSVPNLLSDKYALRKQI